jgi:hypothetical protein
MTIRAADGLISLDTLVARARPAPRPAPATPPAPRSYAPPAATIEQPRAVVLVTTVATCECGRVHHLPNTSVLVRYDHAGMANSVHYRRAEVEASAVNMHLPRERKEHAITVPFCEGCF